MANILIEIITTRTPKPVPNVSIITFSLKLFIYSSVDAVPYKIAQNTE
jgi:hypothetical protein